MARFVFLLSLLFLLTVVRVRTNLLDNYGDLEDPGDMPQSDYPDFSSPREPPNPFFDTDAWTDNEQGENVAKSEPISSNSPDSDDEEIPELRRKRPVVKKSSPRVRTRSVTPNELYQLFGGSPRRKKSAGQRSKSSLLRHFLKSALQRKHISVKKKRSVNGKKAMVKRSGHRKKRDGSKEEIPRVEGEGDEVNPEELMIKKLELQNTLLSKENEFLTEALNEATVGQTNGNDEDTIREEIEQIRNAEKVETIMNQLERDDAAMRAGSRLHGKKEEPDDVEETVMVTNTAVADLTKCPVVKKLANKCNRVSYTYRFEMDEDAADACDAHKICYACSSTFSASRELCDRLFLAQAKHLCAKETDWQGCREGALKLLQAMENVHALGESSKDEDLKDECQNPCVRAYFKGVYRSRR